MKPGEQVTTADEDNDGNLVIKSYQDVEPHLAYTEKLRRAEWEERGQFGKRPEFRHAMSVPFNVLEDVAHKLGIPPGQALNKEYSQRIWAELKKPEYKLFRTVNDKVI